LSKPARKIRAGQRGFHNSQTYPVGLGMLNRFFSWLKALWQGITHRPPPSSCYSSSCKDIFQRFGHSKLLESLESSYRLLLDRRKGVVDFGVPTSITPKKQAVCNCELVRQSLLHRAERLMASSGTLLLEKNVYGLALLIRGHYEATALLGYFCNRLESLADGNIKFDDFKWNVADALMGAKHETFSEARPPLNVLTCIEKADKYLDTHFFEEKKNIIQDCYDWLSEFAHPNFLSNKSAFALDKLNHRFILRHSNEFQESDFELLSYLSFSAGLFIFLFDAFEQRSNGKILKN
jgi:hypothetical protein